jgi:hypothetical protein
MQNFVRGSIEGAILLILHLLHPPIEESVSQGCVDMGHDLRREGTDIFPIFGNVDDPYLFTLNHALLQVLPHKSNMSGHFQPLHLCGQRDYNAGGRELVPHVILNDDPGPLASLHMAGGRDRYIYNDNISTLIRFHKLPPISGN